MILKNVDDKNKVHWFVMIAYKREKDAEAALSGDDGLEYYIAKRYIVKTIRGIKKRVMVPSIPNILFIHASHAEIIKFKEKYNFIKFMIWHKTTGTEYLVVNDAEMENFIRISSSDAESVKYYQPDEINLKKGTRVRILGGEFDGVEGVFVKVDGKRSKQVVVVIPDLLAVSVYVHPDLIEVLD